MKPIRERTETDPFDIEIREEGDNPILTGLGVPYKKWSEKLGWFRERIHPGAAKKTLRESKDIACIYNHNNDKILGRTSAGNLTLRETDKGVFYENPLDDQSYSKDLQINVRNKNIQGNSFAFAVPENKEKWTEQGEEITRNVYEIMLFEVGPQVFPAYSQTKLKLRSVFGGDETPFDAEPFFKAHFFSSKGLKLPERDIERYFEELRKLSEFTPGSCSINLRFLTDFACKLSRGTELNDTDRQLLSEHFDSCRSYLPNPEPEPDPQGGNHSGADGEPGDHSEEARAAAEALRIRNMRKREIELIEMIA